MPYTSRVARLTATIMAAGSVMGTLQAQSDDALIDALVKKGVLTEQEAADLKADAAREHAEKTAKDVRFFWKDGLNFQSGDGETFKGKLGGRIHFDTAFFTEDDDIEDALGDQESGTEFRRTRLALEGTITTSNPTFYKVELDFSGAEVSFKDVFIGMDELPVVGGVKIGHQKEPSSLEGLTSSRYLTFMERALPIEAFWAERNTGITVGNSLLNDHMTWALGGFTSSTLSDHTDGGENFDSDYRVVGRLTGLPYYDEESKGRRLVHLGVSGTGYAAEGNMVRFRSRPEAHLASRLVDTGEFMADNGYVFGAEAATVLGPFSLQGEFFQNWTTGTGGSDPCFHGYYVYASYFLTGENRVYKPSSGAFDRVRPKRSFSLADGSPGAWELGLRYSSVDLNDGAIQGGKLDDITAGVNWYFNPNTKLQFNYVFAQLDDQGVDEVDGDLHAFMTRLAVDF